MFLYMIISAPATPSPTPLFIRSRVPQNGWLDKRMPSLALPPGYAYYVGLGSDGATNFQCDGGSGIREEKVSIQI